MKKNTLGGFFIEKHFFSLPKSAAANSFSVKSSPYDYQVNFAAEKNPFVQVNRQFKGRAHNVLFIDRNVFRLYREYIKAPKDQIFQAQADEKFKTLDGAVKMIDFLKKRNFTKADTLIVVGGGVVQDVAALVGALYKRGISWIFFPTTLLAMCDSCIGAKASINYKKEKNQLGVFCAPKEIYINIRFLKTLDSKQIKSGLGEMFKLCVSGGRGTYDEFVGRAGTGKIQSPRDFEKLVKLALSVKKAIIEADEFDRNFRRGLNYGHTFGHAIEALTDFAVPHGQAVVAGIAIANEISTEAGLLNQKENQILRRQGRKFFDRQSEKALSRIGGARLAELLRQDKKAMGKVLNLVLLKNLGHLVFYQTEVNTAFLHKIKAIIKKIFK